MSLIATRQDKLGNLVKSEYGTEHGYCRSIVSAAQGSDTDYEIGTVLGTADGINYVISVETAVDGSQVPAAIVIEDITVGVGGADVTVISRGPALIAKQALKLDATFDNDAKKAAAYAALEALGIKIADQY